jgi:predicted nucleic acid-binding protein
MIFWDASAIIPLCIDEPQSKVVKGILKKDSSMAVWWGSIVECHSAFARLRRDKVLKHSEEDQVRHLLAILANAWTEIDPSGDIRDIASRLILRHPLRAADSLQLAAALVWAGKTPKGHRFVCLDSRLRDAARKEGFALMPPGFPDY